MAATEALFASISPSVSDAARLNEALTNAISLMASMQSQSQSLRRALYGSLAKLFDRIRNQGRGDVVDFDLTGLKNVLFGPDVDIEALRLLRADAIVSIFKTSPAVALKIEKETAALQAEEHSKNVRDRLAQALTSH